MSQKKLSKVTFHVDGLYTDGHARRCEAMIRDSAGGIESVKANYVAGTVVVIFDVRHQNLHTIRGLVDETGYTILGD
jgi:copper chaperone CopZ